MQTTIDKKIKKRIAEIPEIGDLTKIFFYVNNHDINMEYLQMLHSITSLKDDVIADWLSINTRTLRNYKKSETVLKDNTKEQIVLIIALYKHGINVFGNIAQFDKWLSAPNIFLGNKPPLEMLDTVSGIKFIDDRLTAMEYGDNV